MTTSVLSSHCKIKHHDKYIKKTCDRGACFPNKWRLSTHLYFLTPEKILNCPEVIICHVLFLVILKCLFGGSPFCHLSKLVYSFLMGGGLLHVPPYARIIRNSSMWTVRANKYLLEEWIVATLSNTSPSPQSLNLLICTWSYRHSRAFGYCFPVSCLVSLGKRRDQWGQYWTIKPNVNVFILQTEFSVPKRWIFVLCKYQNKECDW